MATTEDGPNTMTSIESKKEVCGAAQIIGACLVDAFTPLYLMQWNEPVQYSVRIVVAVIIWIFLAIIKKIYM